MVSSSRCELGSHRTVTATGRSNPLGGQDSDRRSKISSTLQDEKETPGYVYMFQKGQSILLITCICAIYG